MIFSRIRYVLYMRLSISKLENVTPSDLCTASHIFIENVSVIDLQIASTTDSVVGKHKFVSRKIFIKFRGGRFNLIISNLNFKNIFTNIFISYCISGSNLAFLRILCERCEASSIKQTSRLNRTGELREFHWGTLFSEQYSWWELLAENSSDDFLMLRGQKLRVSKITTTSEGRRIWLSGRSQLDRVNWYSNWIRLDHCCASSDDHPYDFNGEGNSNACVHRANGIQLKSS